LVNRTEVECGYGKCCRYQEIERCEFAGTRTSDSRKRNSRQLRDSVPNFLNDKPRKKADHQAIDFILENASGDL